jgi:hypothetical protein
MLEIPISQAISSDTTQAVELDGQLVTLRFVWNGLRRDDGNGYFFLTFTDQNGNPIRGIKIVPNWLLLKQYKGSTDFRGDFLVVRSEVEAENIITYDNFGVGWTFNYITELEVDQWEEANGL